jgi:hypothetical protein
MQRRGRTLALSGVALGKTLFTKGGGVANFFANPTMSGISAFRSLMVKP